MMALTGAAAVVVFCLFAIAVAAVALGGLEFLRRKL
jgi:hypothetical protein